LWNGNIFHQDASRKRDLCEESRAGKMKKEEGERSRGREVEGSRGREVERS